MKRFLFLILCVITLFGCEKSHNNTDDGILTVDRKYVSLSSDGGEFVISIESKTSWIIQEGANWCKPSFTYGEGDATVRFFAKRNTSFESRTVFFTIEYNDGSVEIRVDQEALVLEDVVSEMDDSVFAKYCLANFDLNNDGRISTSEADKVKSISLQDMPELRSVKGIEYFKNIEDIEFTRSKKIIEIDLSQNNAIKRIHDIDFWACELLEIIHLPKSVEYMEADAFWGDDNIKSIYFHGSKPPKFESTSTEDGYRYRFNYREQFRIYVPIGAGNAYRSAFYNKRDRQIYEYDYE